MVKHCITAGFVLTQVAMVLVSARPSGQRKCKGPMSIGRGLAIILFSAAIISQMIVLK